MLLRRKKLEIKEQTKLNYLIFCDMHTTWTIWCMSQFIILFSYFPNSFPPWEISFFYHFVSFSDLFSCTTLRFTELLDKLTWGNLWVLQTVARMAFRAYFTSSAGLTASVIWEDASSLISSGSANFYSASLISTFKQLPVLLWSLKYSQ